MATLVFTAIGTLLGGPVGGAIGALAGRQVDALILGGGRGREGPRLAELAVTTSSYGIPIPRHFGRMRAAGQIIWATDLVEHRDTQGGGKGQPSVSQYTYSASFAVALSSRPIMGVGRIWADGKLLRGAAGDMKVAVSFRLHPGTADQAPDPLLASAEAAGRCPAYTGLAYAVFEDLQLADFGNRLPALTFEVLADDGELTLSALVDPVIENVDAAVPLGGVDGLSMDGALIDSLAALDPLYPVDCDACDEQLTIRPDRRQPTAIALPEAATSTERDDFGGNAGFARKRAPEAEQPVAMLRYYDVDRDYQPGAQRAGGRPAPGQPRSIELPAALSAPVARRLIDGAAKRTHWARQTISWRVTQIDPAVRPGATVSLPGHPGLWRVREWEWRSHGVDLTLVRLAPDSAGSTSADPGRAVTAPDRPLGPTALAACELPWDGHAATPVPLVMAMATSTESGWTGAALFAEQADGSLHPLGPSGRRRAIIGTAVTALPPASPLLFDRKGFVDVTLVGDDGTLPDATMQQLATGANRAVLGEEIIQFGSAAKLQDGSWRLSGLLRGRGGTEHAVGSHAEGDRFILLDGAGTPVDAARLALSPAGRLAAIGLADPAPVLAAVQLRGIGWRPPSPVHARCNKLGNGDRLITWVRRARGAWAWADGIDTPPREQAERYDVVFAEGPQVFARWETDRPELLLGAELAGSLLAQAPQGTIRIVQRGDRAPSLPLALPLT